jgi:hypothetical protein
LKSDLSDDVLDPVKRTCSLKRNVDRRTAPEQCDGTSIIGKVTGFMSEMKVVRSTLSNETGRRQLPAAYNHYTL